MSIFKKRIIALERRLIPEVTFEEYLRVMAEEKKGIVVSEKEWHRIRSSSFYKFLESIKKR